MEFNLQDFQKRISTHPQPVYLLFGEEEFLVDQAITLFHQVVDEGTRDFNYDVFYAKESPPSTILDVAETLPMMAPRRVVVIKDVEKWNEPEWSLFDKYFEDPSESTVLVLVAKAVDKRKKTIKRLIESAEAIEFKKLYDNQVPQWIQYMVQRAGLSIERDAVALLQQFVGNNLLDIQSEVQKLAQFLGDRKQILVKDVIDVVSKIKVQSVFDLSRAIGESDKAKALLCLSQLLAHGQNEVAILALISRHVRILRLVKKAKQEGQKGPQIASRAGVSPYFLAEYEAQSRNWTDKKIEKTVKALLDTDRALKSSPLSSHIWLENFIIQTCN
ncbi:MAG: DNA polymerase III subunit delta [Bdellovibrionales bacterium]|nr:DNA polymerase III subunit delta [Bdellovibrionales bacterium]